MVVPHFIFGDKKNVSFCEFMRQALYHPQHGYYRQSTTRQGIHGDYLTAPSMSHLFACCIANNLAPLLQQYPHWSIAEIGPGRADCAIDLMQALAKKKALPKQYHLIEPSPKMQSVQKHHITSRISSDLNRYTWNTRLPESFCGIVLANEVLDALPIHLIASDQLGNLSELWVKRSSPELTFEPIPISPDLLKIFSQRNIPRYFDYRYEVSTEIPSFLASIASSMSSGICLFFDYGYPRKHYYHPERRQGTLTSYYKHQQTNSTLNQPGHQDISVHVDFTCVAESAHHAGLQFCGYTNQERFLLASHLLHILRDDESFLSQADYLALRKSAHLLTSPSEMGETIKVIAFQKHVKDLQLLGFSHGSLGL